MTPATLTEWLNRPLFDGVSKAKTRLAFASALGVHRNTVRRWESGACPMPQWLGYALSAIVARYPPLA